jgi:arylsulfatase A-like enzyme
MPTKPNVVVCMCDQLRAFETGCYGNQVVRTPHIDRLAREGFRFEQAATNNPVCMPARSCLISGQYSRTCAGRLGNYAEKNEDGSMTLPEYPARERTELLDPTLPEQLQAMGYDTALIGKWHIQPAPDLVGFAKSLYPRVHHRHTGQHYLDGSGREWPVDGYSVEYEADQVDRYLGEREDRPFFLFYSISPPHMPVADAPASYLGMYRPDEVPLRPNVFQDGKPAYDEHWFKVYLWDFLYYQERLPHTDSLPDGFDLRHLTALYYGMVTWVDDMVGRLMVSLDSHGLAENTVVVFLSDHGDNLGSHQRFNKSQLLEESIRIPLIFHAPGRLQPGVNGDQVAQIVDVMPTLLELCGGTGPHVVGRRQPMAAQGRSLLPILTGQRQSLMDDAAYIETDGGQIGIRTPSHLYGMQLADDRRTVADPAWCFYDLRSDPFQQHNLAGSGQQAQLAEELRRRLVAWHQRTPWMQDLHSDTPA